MMKLYVMEKASLGRALANVLPGEKIKEENFIRCGDDIVAWASGHLLELCEPEDYDPAYKKWSRETLLYVPEKWKLREKERTKTLFAGLRKLIKGLSASDVVVNGADGDREGQLLIDEILEFCGWKGKTLRLRINDVNPDAIRKALANMKDNSEYLGEYKSGQARLYADWLVGLAMTRYVTVSLREAGYKADILSIGRVQTPTLGLVVFRDGEIEKFSPSPFYELTALLSIDRDRKIKGNWLPQDAYLDNLDEQKRITNKEFAHALFGKFDGAGGSITSVTKKLHKIPPPLPFSLSKLQMAASKKHDITDTLVHAQKLYESALITYPRTGCEYVPEGHFSEAPKIMEAIRTSCPALSDMLSGVDLLRKSAAWDDRKISEHHAIIPTARIPRGGSLPLAEQKIYEMVCARYALQFLPDYEYEETTVEFMVSGETFKATGRTVVNLGWQGWDKVDEKGKYDKHGNGKENREPEKETRAADEILETGEAGDICETQILPSVKKGEIGTTQAFLTEKSTKPPKPYTYHSLLAAMNNIHLHVKDPDIRAKLKEIQGIGTEATQESVLSTLFNRRYLQKKKKQILSTELGKLLIGLLLDGKGSTLVRPDMTALWERRMSEIEEGSASLDDFVSEVVDMVKEITSGKLNIPDDIPGMERKKVLPGEVTEAPCPLECGKKARCFVGKYGPFWKCICSPDVTFRDIGGVPAVREERIEENCPTKGCKGVTVRLVSKKDNRLFWKCAKCGNFFDDADGKPEIREKKTN